MSARTRGWAVVVALVLGLTGLVAATAPAAAHSQQIGSSPEPDDVLVAAPTEVVVEFDTPIVDMGAAVAVRSLDKESIVTGPPTIGERSIAVPLDASAAPGTYTVAYRVVSEDGHTISDTFTYTLAGSTASASASAVHIGVGVGHAHATSDATCRVTCRVTGHGGQHGGRGGLGHQSADHRCRRRPPRRTRHRRSDSLATMTTKPPVDAGDLWSAPTVTDPIDAVVAVPGSKSASNRALILAALSDGESTIRGLLNARDTQLMMAGLRLLGNEVHVIDHEDVGNVTVQVIPHFMRGPASIDVGLAGTVMRFLPPAAALAHGEITFDGDAHARHRPMATVIESLKELGVKVRDRGNGRLPFMIEATGEVKGGEVFVDASRSSQFISGLLLSAARFNAGVTVHHVGDAVPSMPHIDMTVAMLAEHGVRVRRDGATVWHVDPHDIAAVNRHIEPDLSNAAPFLAAAMVTGGRVTVLDWPEQTAQPGDAIRGILEQMGATTSWSTDGLVLTGPGVIEGVDLDLSAVGELAPTVAALAALATSPSRLRGIAHLRGHETDRLAGLAAELTALGGDVEETTDGLLIRPRPLHSGVFHTYHDHRMATAGAILGLRVPGIEVEDIGTTGKTLPDFPLRWSHLLGLPDIEAPSA